MHVHKGYPESVRENGGVVWCEQANVGGCVGHSYPLACESVCMKDMYVSMTSERYITKLVEYLAQN